MKLVAMLRIKNQELTISECLESLSKLVDEIVIVDNNSTDDTQKKCADFSKVTRIKRTKGFDEGRDKILAYKLAKEQNADWILWIDGDEVFETALNRKILDGYMNDVSIKAVHFRLYHFWGGKNKFRVDGPWLRYTAYPQRSMWKNIDTTYFDNKMFHSGGVLGINGKQIISRYRIKHFGYINSKQIEEKQKTYQKLMSNPMSVKTMPLSKRNIKLISFKEPKNKFFLNIVQISENFFWNIATIMDKFGLLSRVYDLQSKN